MNITDTGKPTRTDATLRGQTLYFIGGYANCARGEPFAQLVVPRKAARGQPDGVSYYGEWTHAAYATDMAGSWYFVRYVAETGKARCNRCKLPNYSRLPHVPPRMGTSSRSQWGYLPQLKRDAIEALRLERDNFLTVAQLRAASTCDLI